MWFSVLIILTYQHMNCVYFCFWDLGPAIPLKGTRPLLWPINPSLSELQQSHPHQALASSQAPPPSHLVKTRVHGNRRRTAQQPAPPPLTATATSMCVCEICISCLWEGWWIMKWIPDIWILVLIIMCAFRQVDTNSKNVFGQPRLRASLRDLRSPRRSHKSTIEDDLKKLIIMDNPAETPSRDAVSTHEKP